MSHRSPRSCCARRGAFLCAAVALFLLLLPAGSLGQGDDGRFERNRQRWERMSPAERALMRERFEKMRRMSPEERRELEERARNLRHLEDGLRKAPPRELWERLRRHRFEKEREEEVRRYLREHAERFGRRMREKLPPDLREKLEKASSPEERRSLLHRYFMDRRRERGFWTERAIRMLDLPPAEKKRLLALPPEAQEDKVLELKRRWLSRMIEERGLPPGITAEEWRRMKTLSDREFFNRLRYVERLPEHMRGREFWGGGRGPRGRDGEARRGERRRPRGGPGPGGGHGAKRDPIDGKGGGAI